MSNKNGLIVKASNVKKEFETPAGSLHILRGVDFEVASGDLVHIVGRSGSGKSTLLHLLGALDRLSSGHILFRGEDITKMDEWQLAHLRNTQIGFIFQSYHLLPELTLYENVMLPSMIAGVTDQKWVKELLKRVKLWSRKDHYPSELSGGEMQRGAIARALVNKPSIVFCDEPTGNLDEETAENIHELICDFNASDGQAFVIVTHDENWAWRHSCVYRLHEGVLAREQRGAESEQPPDSIGNKGFFGKTS